VSNQPAWDAKALRNKASLYFERAFAAQSEEDAELFSLWIHLGLELLERAAVAKVNPALLALGNKPASLLYGLGLEPQGDPLSLVSAQTDTIISLCEKFVPAFGKGEAAVCHEVRRRRNAELHTAMAAMTNLESGWLGRVFATCKVLADHLGIDLEELFGPEEARQVERLIAEDAASVHKEVRAAIHKAGNVAAKLSAPARAERENEAKMELLQSRHRPFGDGSKPRVLREVACPGCGTEIALRGDVVRSGAPRVDQDGQLVQTDVALPTRLECPVCELQLIGLAKLTDAGLGDPVPLRDYPDPVETFDVDLSDYHDDFLQSLGPEYEDE
jgi:hypothetical protein